VVPGEIARPIRMHGADALDQQPATLPRVGYDDELSGARPAAEPHRDEPVSLAQRRLHAAAGDRDPGEER
jgi:hypothetical protein